MQHSRSACGCLCPGTHHPQACTPHAGCRAAAPAALVQASLVEPPSLSRAPCLRPAWLGPPVQRSVACGPGSNQCPTPTPPHLTPPPPTTTITPPPRRRGSGLHPDGGAGPACRGRGRAAGRRRLHQPAGGDPLGPAALHALAVPVTGLAGAGPMPGCLACLPVQPTVTCHQLGASRVECPVPV